MKNRLLMVLVTAAFVAAVLLLWIEHRPEDSAGSAGELSRVELDVNPGLSPAPGDRDAAVPVAAGNPDEKSTQANGSAIADVRSSRTLNPEGADRAALDLPGDEDSEKSVIGGTVEDEDGNPQSNFEVLAERIHHSDSADLLVDSAPHEAQSVFSDFNGTFLFDSLEDGEYRLSLAPVEGMAPAQTRVRAGTLNARLVVVVPRDVRVHGKVNSTNGGPVKGVNILAEPTARSTTSGKAGEYQLDVNWLGHDVVYTVLFQKKGYRQQRIRISPADLDRLPGEFQLDVSMESIEQLATVAGRLTDTEGNPVGGETIHLLTPRMRTWYQVQSDASGYFLFEDVEPGMDHRLQIRPASGYKNKDISPLLVPGDGLSLDIVLERLYAGKLSGWMIDLDGQPIPRFSLTLRSNTATARSVSVVGDQQGFFSVEDFPVGDALFLTSSYPVLMVEGIRVSAEPKEPITVILDTGRYVQKGQVMDRFGVPLGQSAITLGWAFADNGLRSTSTRRITTDQHGQFVFTGLGPDLHTLEISSAGFNTATKTINVGADPVDIVIELQEEL